METVLHCYRERPAQRWIAVEGIPFIGIGLLLTLALALFFGAAIALLGLLLTGFVVFFFRNPSRTIPTEVGVAISPADGKIVDISLCEESRYLHGKATRIGIFMSPLNCHINRSPVAGSVVQTGYQTGQFKAAFHPKAMETNEHHALLLQDATGGRWLVVQIAGWLARRIVSYTRPGDALERGERFGLIRFGSRVDLYCPTDYDMVVKLGDKVFGGETILARKKKSL